MKQRQFSSKEIMVVGMMTLKKQGTCNVVKILSFLIRIDFYMYTFHIAHTQYLSRYLHCYIYFSRLGRWVK